MLKNLKRGIIRSLFAAGVGGAVADSRWRKKRLLILCYHGIARADEHRWRPSLFLRPDLFRERMELVREWGCHVLPLGEGLRRLFAGELPPRSVSITFDDGELGFYTHAFPILREFDFPATVYLSTHYVENSLPVVTVFLSYLLWKARGASTAADLPYLGVTELDATTPERRSETFDQLMARMRSQQLDSESKNRVLEGVARALDLDWDRLRSERRLELMSPAEIRELSDQGIKFELHTHRHRTPEGKDEFLAELSENRRVIRRLTGTNPSHFCYPSGRYNDRIVSWLRAMDLQSATTCDPGLAAPDADSLLLPRLVDVPTLSRVEFEAWLTGVSSFLPRKPSWAR